MYGKEEYTKKCIELTLKNAGVIVDILVVDDGSPKPFDYVDYTKGHYLPPVRLDKNTGYTNATNQGILFAQGKNYEYVHLLNNDVEPEPDFIKHLLDEIEKDDSIAIASSTRLHKVTNGVEVELYGLDLLRGFQCVTRLEHLKNEVIQCNWVPTCSALIRMSVIRELGLLDKHMRTHSSDLDYCLRAKMAGYKIVIVTDSRVLHHHAVTTKEHNITPEHDQKVLLEKLAGLQYAQFMKAIPLDCESKTYGKLDFTIYQK